MSRTELDLGELRQRLSAAGIFDVTPLAGGASSLTFRGERDGRAVVVKVAQPGVAPVGHRDVLRQARIIEALAVTEVPVPDVLWQDDGDPPLFVMSRVEGDCVEPLFDGWPPRADLAERYRSACRAMAALHSLSPPALGLAGEPVVEAVDEVRRWCATLATVDPALVAGWEGVRNALLRCPPTAMGARVVHGDFRLGNLIASGAEIKAVIDWEIWSIGDPRIDAGWFLINCDPQTYQRVEVPAGAVPSTADLADIYRRELGREVAELGWFCALACFKSAATWSLIVKHNRRKSCPRPELEAMAAVLPKLLARARSLLD